MAAKPRQIVFSCAPLSDVTDLHSLQEQAKPLVSVILTTRDRPRFLSIALACYSHQTYPNRELIVVDDGAVYPCDPAVIEAAGGRLVRRPPGDSIGAKLNCGGAEARGEWCQKMDDDDWYAPDFLEKMIGAVMANRTTVCRPVVAFVAPFLFFELSTWTIRASRPNNFPGATLIYARENWEQSPFRPLMNDEDLWFLLDQCRQGASALPVRALESFLAVRHGRTGRERGHTWVHQSDGSELEHYLNERPVHRTPEELLPEWVIARYSGLRQEIRNEC
jgi:glycosyltransferase involved in cell wall biosynthesis